MSTNDKAAFIPALTVMVDYGGAPFLWLADNPEDTGVGLLLCNALPRFKDEDEDDENYPLSKELWRKFADWAIEFHHTAFYSEAFNADDWDWIAYHARGLQLSCMLKKEVGNDYHVIYWKPYEDPNHHINERIKIHANGELLPLPPFDYGDFAPCFCQCILSAGQLGAERGALDFSINKYGYAHAGWVAHGRKTEDGFVPLKYQLTELTDANTPLCVYRNVADSDGTLIINLGEWDDETLEVKTNAHSLGKPYFVAQLTAKAATETPEVAAAVLAWLRKHSIKTLHVTGSSESKRPGIYQLSKELLQSIDAALHMDG